MSKLPGKHMKLGLSDGYKIAKILDKRRERPVLNPKKIESEISEADLELENSLHQFQKLVTEVLDGIEGEQEKDMIEKIVYLRIHGIQISASFNDFIDTLDSVFKNSDKDFH